MSKTNSGPSRTKMTDSQQSIPQSDQPARVKLTFGNLSQAVMYLSQNNPDRFSNLTLRSSSNGSGKVSLTFDTTL